MSSPIVIGILSALLLSVPTAHSATCSSQVFPKNKVFQSCLDLPTLSSFLHWTYDSSQSSLDLAFLARPPKPEGWIAWGINPSKPAMLGTRALLAYPQPNGSLVVQTYNISGFDVKPSPISYPVSGLSATALNGTTVIFATVALPKGTISINHVWQVGPSVTGGIPAKHEMAPANLGSVGMLNLVKSPSGPGSVSPAPAPAPGAPFAPGASSPSSAPRSVFCSLLGVVAAVGLFFFH